MQDDLQSLQMQLVQRQMAEPGLALSPALLFGDPTLWGEDPKMLTLLRDVAYGQGRLDHGSVQTPTDLSVSLFCCPCIPMYTCLSVCVSVCLSGWLAGCTNPRYVSACVQFLLRS